MDEWFGHYLLQERLGLGGMGEVFRALDSRQHNRVVALKRLLPVYSSDPLYEAHFRREAKLTAGLNNRHVVPVFDYGEIDGQLFLAMRLIIGERLDVLLAREGPLPERRATRLVTQVARALDAAHAEGLIHRDLKPANILLESGGGSKDSRQSAEDDFAYLIDFGIASSLRGTRLFGLTGKIVGTLAYMAPERFRGEREADFRSDIYSLGCMLFELLTSAPAVVADDPVGFVWAHANNPPPRPTNFVPALSPGLDDVIARAMAKDPSARYSSAGDLARAAEHAVEKKRERPTRPSLRDGQRGTPEQLPHAHPRRSEPTVASSRHPDESRAKSNPSTTSDRRSYRARLLEEASSSSSERAARAMFDLGRSYVFEDLGAAKMWLSRAAASGYSDVAPAACMAMGNALQYTLNYTSGVSDKEIVATEARAWYEQAIAAGNREVALNAMRELSTLLERRGDSAGAEELLTQVARSENAHHAREAQSNLGRMAEARGDLEGAQTWFERVLSSGESDGYDNVSTMLDLSKVLAKGGDIVGAIHWSDRVVRSGHLPYAEWASQDLLKLRKML